MSARPSHESWGRPVAPKPRPEKETHVNTETKPEARAVVSESARTPAKKSTAAKPKAAAPSKTRKAARRPLPSSRGASNSEKLVCRYCGSDDLAPSFKKRHDARCRACFKKRYGSAARCKKAVRTRKTKAAK